MAMLDFNDRATMLSQALAYAGRGWPVFPCSPANKRPLVERGFLAATTNALTIKGWWAQFPNAMIGIPTGEKTGFDVLDIDTDSTKGKDGIGSLASLGRDLSELMDTAVARTGSGGYHCLFRHLAGITNSRGSLPPFLDVRGEGGYIIAAGSRLADGRAYEWLNPPEENEIEAWPDWLLEKIKGKPSADVFDFNGAKPSGPNAAERMAQGIPPGQWWERTRDLVARMVKEGSSDETIIAIAPAYTEPGYTVAQTVREFLTHARTARVKWGSPSRPLDPAEPAAVEGDGDRKRLPILSRAELRDREPPDYLIDEVITERSVIAVYGPSGSLKSFVAIDLGMSVAHGLAWHGREVKQGAVVYVTGEGTAQIGQRFDAWDAARGTVGVDAPIHLVPLGVPISDPQWVTTLIEDIQHRGIAPVMIWLDTLARTFGAGDENSQKDMNGYVTGVDRLRDTFGCVVGIVHHTGKDGDRGLRGSSALYAAMDTVIRTDRKDLSVTLKNQQPHGKQKDGAEFDDITLDARIVTLGGVDKKGRALSSLALFEGEARPSDDEEPAERSGPARAQGGNQQAVMKALRAAKGEPLGLTRLCAMTRLANSKVFQALPPLIARGLVSETEERGVKRWTLA